MGVTAKLRRLTEAQWQALREQPESIFELLRERKAVVDIDKAWDGILWLISEERREGGQEAMVDPSDPEAWSLAPPNLANIGGTLVRWASPRHVEAIVKALDAIDDAALRARFDPDAMSARDVYPDIWAEEDEALAYLSDNFARVRRLYRQAAKAGDGVLVILG